MSKSKFSKEQSRGPEDFCPCGAGQVYNICCGKFIEAEQHAQTSEELMRSRYSAYVLEREEYLLRTWHASTRPLKLDVVKVQWLGLQVRRTQAGTAADDAGIVEFVARYKLNGKAERLQETSRFVKEAGRWFYLNAVTVAEKPASHL